MALTRTAVIFNDVPQSTFAATATIGNTVRLVGELDLSAAAELARVLQGMERRQGEELVADLSGLTFCSCSGLATLLDEYWLRLSIGSALILAAPTRPVKRALELTGLDQVFTIRDLTG